MPRKSKTEKERLGKYQDQINRSYEHRNNQGYDRLWKNLLDVYMGGHELAKDISPSDDRIQVNMAFSTINVMHPSISGGIPKFTLTANDPMKEGQAEWVEGLMNYAWKHWDFQSGLQAAGKDFLLFGHGWVKSAWSLIEEEQPLSGEEAQEIYETLAAEAERVAREAPELAGDLPSNEDIAATIGDTAPFVVEDQPVAARISPFDMFVNIEATSMRDIRWIAQRIIRHIDDVRDDELFDKKARNAVKGSKMTIDAADPRFNNFSAEGSSPELIETWEFYDVVDGVMCVFVKDHDDYLLSPRPMPYMFGHPYEMLRNYEIPDHFYPMGDLEQIVPLQLELDKTRSEMMNFRKKYARKYLFRKDAFGGTDYEKLTSSRDNEAIPVEGNIPLQDVVVPLPINNLDAGLFNWSGQISADIQEVSGVSEYARGGQSSIRRTATEAALIQDALNARSGEKLQTVERVAARIGRKMLQLMQQFFTGQRAIQVFGRDGQIHWQEFDRASIQGEYDFMVEAGSTQPHNETFKRQSAMALLQVAMPFVQMGIGNPVELYNHLLREGFSIRTPEKFIAPEYMQMLEEFRREVEGQQPQQGGGQPAQLGGLPGLDAPQQDPGERREQEQQQAFEGVPPEIAAQLQGQVGVQPQL